jgi:2,4-dienoyl-CoA reductase-like NADH-dependent reductase (Old Yellow Enzyme family)
MGAFGRPHAASESELEQVIRAHAEAAARAEHAGFDGVQVHAAHGYLINQFLAPDVNRRSDRWGGDVAGRARLLIEVVRAVRAATKPSFSLLVKLNSADFLRGGLSADDALAVVSMLASERIDLLEISGGRYESGAAFGYNLESPTEEGYFASFARRARPLSDIPLLLTGGLRTRAAIQRGLSEGSFALAGLARPMLLDPHYPRALLQGRAVPSICAPQLASERLRSAAEMAWWYAQIARLGAGHEAAEGLSAWRALFGYFGAEVVEGLSLRWSRPRLARGLALPS